MKTTKTTEIIRDLGGPSTVAKCLGVSPQAVSLWGACGRIPADRVPAMEGLARQRGLPVRAEHMRPDIPWHVLRSPT